MKESFQTKLTNYLKAGYPLLAVETHEEARCLAEIMVVGTVRNELGVWDLARGLAMEADNGAFTKQSGTDDPREMMGWIATLNSSCVFVVRDLHKLLVPETSNYPILVRELRNLIPHLKENKQTIIFLSPRFEAPMELKEDIQFVEFSLPNAGDLQALLEAARDEFRTLEVKGERLNKDVAIDPEFQDGIVAAATGLTTIGAENAFALAGITVGGRHEGKIEISREFSEIVFEEKVNQLRSGLLDYKPTFGGFETLGGLDVLKDCVTRCKVGFKPEARTLNLPLPRGILLNGFAGTGKSVAAMAIAHELGFPFFTLDLGKLFGSRLGESEANTRQLIRTVESLGRAVILIDEIEKSFSVNATSGASDSGASSRMFGTLMSWMATKTCPAIFVGTMNSVDNLPPELIRPGRFDELFFCDLPSEKERIAIFTVLLTQKYKWPLTEELPATLISNTQDYTGAEIESVIQSGLYSLLLEGEHSWKLLAEEMVRVSSEKVPQARIDTARVAQVRSKAQKVFRMASKVEAKPVSVKSSGTRSMRL